METCKICGRTFEKRRGLSYHIIQAHNLQLKDYYDQYLKQPNEGTCVICGKPTKYIGFKYKETCSPRCTCMLRYDVEHNSQIPEIKAKMHTKEAHKKSANNKNWTEITEKCKTTKLERYGNATYNNTEKAQQTNLAKIGKKSYLSLDSVHEKGVIGSHAQKIEQIRQRTRKSTGWHKNKVENYFVEKLNDIQYKQNYKSTIYPYRCDFYFPEFDLYIEINNYWAHGQHFYDSNNKQDNELLQKWKDKSKQPKDQYSQAFKTWLHDLDKKECALKNNLNYIVLWNYEQIDRFFELFKKTIICRFY